MTLPLSPEELKAYNNIPCTPLTQKLGDTINALVGGGGGGPNINFKPTPQYGFGFAASDTLTLPAGVITPVTQAVLVCYSATVDNGSSTEQPIMVTMENTSTATFLTPFSALAPSLSQNVVDSVLDTPGGGLDPGTYMDSVTFNPVAGTSGVNYIESIFPSSTVLAFNSGLNQTFVWVDVSATGGDTYTITFNPPASPGITWSEGFLLALHPLTIGT
jgi:hypothetical protein